MVEFTGERIVPGSVDADLFNEHISRYYFAAHLAAGKRCLDAGCGLGYGSAALARRAREVAGVDNHIESIAAARQEFGQPNCLFTVADVLRLPFANGAFNLTVSFEVVEHLKDWRGYLRELDRVTNNSGMVCLSTPNRDYYEVSRGAAGPNPFHVHEFAFCEFVDALMETFPHVRVLGQNTVPAICFFGDRGPEEAQVHLDSEHRQVEDSQFFLALCSRTEIPEIPDFGYVATTGNVLYERARHIALLEEEVQLKTKWLDEATSSLNDLNHAHRNLAEELAQRSAWASQATQTLQERNQTLAAELEGKCEELARAVDLLHQCEQSLEERTRWAQGLDAHNLDLRERIDHLEQEIFRTVSALTDERFRAVDLERTISLLHKKLYDLNNLRARELTLLAEVLQIDRRITPTILTLLRQIGAHLTRSRRRAELLNTIRDSRWVRLGRRLGVGPDLNTLP